MLVERIEGKWIDESYIKHPIINSNIDVYYKDNDGNEILLLKFRKNCISNSLESSLLSK